MITVTRYGTRYWAVWLDGELVVVALYKKGAASVAAKLRELLVLKGSDRAETTTFCATAG